MMPAASGKTIRATSALLLILLLTLTTAVALAARPANLLNDFAKTQLIIDASGTGCVLFDVYVAQSAQQRSQGLMHIESMDLYEGMIFLYPEEAQISMWMKNTLISLDMLFVSRDRNIATIQENAVPMSEEIIRSNAEVVAVIELNAGAVKHFAISAGDKIIFPAG